MTCPSLVRAGLPALTVTMAVTLALTALARGGEGSGKELDLPVVPPPPAPAAERPAPSAPPGRPPAVEPRAIPVNGPGERLPVLFVTDATMRMRTDPQPSSDADGRVRTMTRFQRAQEELVPAIRGLGLLHRFDVVAIGCGARWWDTKPERLRPCYPYATGEMKERAIAWVRALTCVHEEVASGARVAELLRRCHGGHRIAPGRLVLLDALPPGCGLPEPEENLRMIRAANLLPAQVDTVAVRAPSEVRAYLARIAQESAGTFTDLND